MPAELYGPAGLLVALVLATAALWRDHVRADADVRTQRDTAIVGWQAQTTATNRLADSIEERERGLAQRTRQGDR